MRRLGLMILLLGVPLLAQPPRGFFNWWDSPVAKDLNLNDDQTKQIRGIVREYRSKLIDQRAAVEKAEADFEDQFNDEAVDQRKANEALDRLVTARGELTRAFSQMSLRLRLVLTPDQFKELQKRRPRMQPGGPMQPGQMRREMQQRRMDERQPRPGRLMGPGGPGGAPGGPAPQNPPPPRQQQ